MFKYATINQVVCILAGENEKGNGRRGKREIRQIEEGTAGTVEDTTVEEKSPEKKKRGVKRPVSIEIKYL